MAKKTTELPIKTIDLESTDQLILVDSADATDSPEGTDKRVAATRLVISDGNETRVSGGGVFALGGHDIAAVSDGDLATLTDVATKADTVHTHVEADVTDLDKYTQAESDAAFAPIVHTHLAADVTDLQPLLDAKITSDATITGTGSLDLGVSVLTTGDKTGVIATEDDLSSGLDVSAIVIPCGNRHGSQGLSYSEYSGVQWLDAYLPAGWTVKFCAILEDPGSVRIETIGGTALSGTTLSRGSGGIGLLQSGAISPVNGTTYLCVYKSDNGGTNWVVDSWLLLEAP